MSEVNYEMAWRFLKKLVEQFKESDAYIAQSTAENFLEQHHAIGRAYMARLILEEMGCMEEAIADAMRGDEGDE